MVNAIHEQLETVVIDGETFTVVLLNLVTPVDVTDKQGERRQPNETFDESMDRLLTKEIIEGARDLNRANDDTWRYVESASDPRKLYRLNAEKLHGQCPAPAFCKHVVLMAAAMYQTDRRASSTSTGRSLSQSCEPSSSAARSLSRGYQS